MKIKTILCTLCAVTVLGSCSYDDDGLWDAVNGQEEMAEDGCRPTEFFARDSYGYRLCDQCGKSGKGWCARV